MRATIRTAAAALVLLAFATFAGAQDDTVFRAMQDELDRSMGGLVIEDMPSPYFISYQIQDAAAATVEARYGALVHSEERNERHLYVECRVGNSELDNTYFASSWQDMNSQRRGVAEEDDYDALRRQIWLHTDGAYKRSLEQLAHKHAYLQTHPQKEHVPDFSAAEPFVSVEKPIRLEVDVAAWEDRVRDAAEALEGFKLLQDWRIVFRTAALNRRYVNSEGSRHLKSAAFDEIEVAATGQAADGQRLTNFLRYAAREGDGLPTGGELVADVRAMAAELEAMLAAETLDEYWGPVLFAEDAAAQLMVGLFATQVVPPRSILVAQEWMSQYLPDPKLTGRLNRRILPEFVTVTDEPTRDSWKGVKLVGHKLVDDEGVPCTDITLVEEGRLVDLPMSRTPIKKIAASNGHALTLPNEWTTPTTTNLFVSPSKTKKDLVGELRKLCREFDIEFGLLVTRLDEPGVSRRYRWIESQEDASGELLAAPIVVYKVYEDDGRLEPVRGLAFDEPTIRTLRDIYAMGDELRLNNLAVPVGPPGMRLMGAVITPDILVEEMECKASAAGEPMMIGARP